MYLMGCLTERARMRMAWQAARDDSQPEKARRAIADALPPLVGSEMEDPELEVVRLRLARASQPHARLLTSEDWLGALGVFLLVFLCTFPVVLPFMFMRDAWLAMRVSNGIAIVMLFICGWSWGRFTGLRPWLVGSIMVLLGAILAATALALGG
jgi:VIT1/CCC1 family predicted Fe2+/Mn2+ transporter